jgi:hypothetical protein
VRSCGAGFAPNGSGRAAVRVRSAPHKVGKSGSGMQGALAAAVAVGLGHVEGLDAAEGDGFVEGVGFVEGSGAEAGADAARPHAAGVGEGEGDGDGDAERNGDGDGLAAARMR